MPVKFKILAALVLLAVLAVLGFFLILPDANQPASKILLPTRTADNSPASSIISLPTSGQASPVALPVSPVNSTPPDKPSLAGNTPLVAGPLFTPIALPSSLSPTPSQKVVTATGGRLQNGVCRFDGQEAASYLRPEHFEALQPQFRPAGQLPAAPTLYHLDMIVNPLDGSYSGQADIIFWNRAPDPMPGIMLRTYPDFYRSVGGSLNLKEAALDGKPLMLKDNGLTFVLGQGVEVPPCSQARLKVSFEGHTANQLREDAYAVGTFYSGQGFFALGNFYPQLALWQKPPGQARWEWAINPVRASSDLTAAESAFYEVNIKAPSAYQLIGSGLSKETTVAEGGQRAWHFVGGPLREFAVVGGNNFQAQILTGTTQGNVAVKVYTVNTPESAVVARQQDFARKARDVTIATLEEFSAAVGPYPYVEYTLVQFPLIGFNGIEWPMFSQFSFDLFRRSYVGQEQELDGLVYSKPGTLVVIHEVLHQWWYNLTGNDQQTEPFIDEGLTEYSAYLLPELRARRKGSNVEAARKIMRSGLDNLRNRVRQQDLPAYGDLRVNTPANGFSLKQAGFILYRKAPLFYEAYRNKFGDAALFTFFKNYYVKYRYQLVHFDELATELAQAAQGRESEARLLVNRWLNELQLAVDL